MPHFTYSARAAGAAAPSAGAIDALSRREALHLLQARGLQVVRLEEEGGAIRAPVGSVPAEPLPLSTKQRLPFLEALADLVQAGLSAGEGNRTVIIAGGAADVASQAAAQAMNRFLNRLPTITIREGHRVKVYLTSDLELPAYTAAPGRF